MLSVRVTGTNKTARSIMKKLDTVIAKVSSDAFKEVRGITPVLSGRAKKAWKLQKRGKYNVEVVNRVPYASRLNQGYSSKAPRGITRPASRSVVKKYR